MKLSLLALLALAPLASASIGHILEVAKRGIEHEALVNIFAQPGLELSTHMGPVKQPSVMVSAM
jgi:hypothetical protein